MAIDKEAIQVILKKRKWTGEEVGQVLIYSVIDAFKQQREHERPFKPILPQDKFDKMRASLISEVDIKNFNFYIHLNNWLLRTHPIASAHYAQIRTEINGILALLNCAGTVESAYNYNDWLPLIMTQKQYDESRKEPTHYRETLNGVAILIDNGTLESESRKFIKDGIGGIDERGYYVEPAHINEIFISLGLERFTSLNKNCTDDIQSISESRVIINKTFIYIAGYNKAIELISERIDISEFNFFRVDQERIIDRLNAITNNAGILRESIENTDYSDNEVKEQKLKILEVYFKPYDVINYVVPEEVIQIAKILLEDREVFKGNNNRFLDLFMYVKGGV